MIRRTPGNPVFSACILALAAALALMSVVKGFPSEISEWGRFYWLVNYNDGFIKRGLVGHIFETVFGSVPLDRRFAVVVTLHLIATVLLIAVLLVWSYRNMVRSPSSTAALGTVLVLFTTSQLLSSITYMAGYLDIYLYLILVASAALIAGGHFMLAGLMGSLGPFVHESFAFMWVTCMILMWWPSPEPTQFLAALCRLWRGVVAALLPIIATVAVLLFHRQDAAVAQIMAAPLPPGVKTSVIGDQFGQTVISSLTVMMGIFRAQFGNFILAAVFCLAPTAMMVALYATSRFREHLLFNTAVLSMAAFAPAAMVLFGWDLSRFLVATALTALIAILVSETRRAGALRDVGSLTYACAWCLALFGFLVPLIYGNFWRADVAVNRLPLSSTIVERGVRAFVETRYNP